MRKFRNKAIRIFKGAKVKKLFCVLLDLIYPPKCPFCRSVLERKAEGVCPLCEESLPHTGEQRVRRLENGIPCYSPLRYEGRVRDAVHRYKFGGLSGYAAPFAGRMAHCLRQERDTSVFVVSWVPLSKKRLRRRGYDQARLLAGALAEELGLAPPLPLLRKIRDTRAQSSLTDEEERRKNVRDAYELTGQGTVKGAHILLVDDVVTTGATLMACARLLRRAGAAEVCAVTLARTAKGEEIPTNPCKSENRSI